MKRKVKLIQVIGEGSLTGAPRHLLTLLKFLDRRHFIIKAICPPGPLVNEIRKTGTPVFQVPMRGRSDVLAVNAIKKILRRERPDIIHCHGARAGLIGRLAAKGFPLKIVYTEHTRTPQFKLPSAVLEWSHKRALRVLDQFTDITIAVSRSVADFLKKGIARHSKIVVIYNGLEKHSRPPASEVVKIREKYGIKGDDLVIGTIGSLNYQKDHKTLIKAFEKVIKKRPNAKLVLVGGGALKHYLEKLARRYRVADKVVMTGAVVNVQPLLAAFDIFVLPSLSEAFGLSLLEAMQAGVPIIATKVGGIPEVIKPGYNGLLVAPGNPKELASAIMRLLNDRQLQKKIVRHYGEVLDKFSAKNMVDKTEQVYLELVS